MKFVVMIMKIDDFTSKYREIYLEEVNTLGESNPNFKKYAEKLFDENPTLVKKLFDVYVSKEVSNEELHDAFSSIALYCLMHFEEKIDFQPMHVNVKTNDDLVAFVFSEGKGSRLSLMGLNADKAMLEMPHSEGFTSLVQLACKDLLDNGLKTVVTTSERTRESYNNLFRNHDNVILTTEPGRNKYEALVECVNSLDELPTAVFRTCGDTLRSSSLLKKGIEKQDNLSNPEDYIIVLGRVLDETTKNGLSSVSVKTDGDTALSFTKSPSIKPEDDVLLYKVGSIIGKNMLKKLLDAGDVSYNSFCNNLPAGSVLLVTEESSENCGIDDVFDLLNYTKENFETKSMYDTIRGKYERI
jgi:hypothetical protein